MTGYVRKDTTNNIADGNVINAADLDAEFDGVQDAFNASTGHNHDGTAGEGATINALGPTQDVTISATLVAPKTTNTVDIGSSSLKFKDLYLAGNGSIGGTLAVTGVATFTAQPIVSSLTASRAVFSDGSKGLVSNAITGTGNVVMSASPTLTGTITAEALTASSTVTLSGGTANGVTYLNGSKVVTSGSALTFDGSNLSVVGAYNINQTNLFEINNGQSGGTKFASGVSLTSDSGGNYTSAFYVASGSNTRYNLMTGSPTTVSFYSANAEQMRLTSTGLGIGTSSITSKLTVSGAISASGTIFRPDSGFIQWNSTGASGGTNRAIIWADSSSNLYFGNGAGNSTSATIDSSGNLGLGVTPSAWSSSYKGFQMNGGALQAYTSGDRLAVNQNAFVNSGGVSAYVNTGYASQYLQLNSEHRFYTAASGTAGNAITFTQAMTLDASGVLMVGKTSNSAYAAGGALFAVNGAADNGVSIAQSNATGSFLTFFNSANSGFAGISQTAAGTLSVSSSTALTFNVNSAERARIDSSGNLLVGTTSALNSAAKINAYNTSGGNGGVAIGYGSDAGQYRVMYLISSNGGLYFDNASNAAYLNSAGAWTNASDARLKNSITDIKYGLSAVLNTQPRSYKMNDLEGDYIGFVAQELQNVIPEVVSGDPEKQLGVDYGSLVAVAFKAIQEQQAIIESLKARLDAANL